MNPHQQPKGILHCRQHKGIFHLQCQPSLQQPRQRMTPCKLIRHDSSPSQSKRNNVNIQIIFVYIVESQVMLFVNVQINMDHMQHVPSLLPILNQRSWKRACPVLVGTARLDLDASCNENGPSLSLDPTPCFLVLIIVKFSKLVTMEA